MIDNRIGELVQKALLRTRSSSSVIDNFVKKSIQSGAGVRTLTVGKVLTLFTLNKDIKM